MPDTTPCCWNKARVVKYFFSEKWKARNHLYDTRKEIRKVSYRANHFRIPLRVFFCIGRYTNNLSLLLAKKITHDTIRAVSLSLLLEQSKGRDTYFLAKKGYDTRKKKIRKEDIPIPCLSFVFKKKLVIMVDICITSLRY